MDQQNTDSLFGFHVDFESARYFRDGTKWARFIAIVIFAGIAIGILAFAFSSYFIMEALRNYMPGMDILGGLIAVVAIIALAVYVLIAVFLYRFATLTRRGIETQNQALFNDGLKSLKYYFLITGIIAILGIIGSVFSSIATLTAASL